MTAQENSLVNVSFKCSPNLLNNENLKLFYQAKEALNAYAAIDLVTTKRREIANEVIDILERFLQCDYKEEETNYILELQQKGKTRVSNTSICVKGLLEKLQSLDSEAVRLLGIDDTINIKKLKICYNQASKKYHPDLGGSNEQMQKVNEAFALFHEVISNYNSNDLSQSKYFAENSPDSWEEWKFSCYFSLSLIYGDFFAADKAFHYFKTAHVFSKESRPSYVGALVSNLFNSSDLMFKVCGALGRFKMLKELQEAAAITSHFLDVIVDQRAKDSILYDTGRSYYPPQSRFLEEYGTKIVITHLEQAKNAFRLGKIDEKRFHAALKKFGDKKEKSNKFSQAIELFYKQNPAIIKLNNTTYDLSDSPPSIITPLGFFQNRFSHLENDQKFAYVKSFSEQIDGETCLKYLSVRATEILLGLITNYENIDLNNIEREITFINENIPSAKENFFPLEQFLQHLRILKESERIEKLKLLASMDILEQKTHSFFMSFSINSQHPKEGYKKRIESTDEYIDFATMTYEALLKFKIDGTYKSDSGEAWNSNLRLLDKFHKSQIAKKRDKVWLETKSPSPEMIIDSTEPYIEGLLELGRIFHEKHTGELQIGYDIDRLTTAYAKIKNWKKVIFWGELFFSLPDNYRKRSSDGEQEKIRSRLERAIKILQTKKEKS